MLDDVWVNGPPAVTPIEVAPSDPAWPADFARVERRVREALGARVLDLVHVGSTSVPGLAAKPIIDADLTVADSAAEDDYVPALEAAGFRLDVRERQWHEHRMFAVVDPGSGPERLPRTNLHVFSPGCPEVERHRALRDWLGTHPDDRARYEEAKKASAAASTAAGEHVMDYNRRKEPVLLEILDRALRQHDAG